MNGKLLVSGLLIAAAAMGGGLYYAQNYAYYEPVDVMAATTPITLVGGGGDVMPLPAEFLEVLQADTSPLKYRACLTVTNSIPMMTETYELYENATPLKAPNWFECFDYKQLTADLEDGTALAFLGQAEIADGVDSVLAVYDDGRAFAWHQLNDKYTD